MKKILFLAFIMFISFQSKEERKKRELNEDINTAWTLLSVAANAPESELSVPLGFQLNCTEAAYQKRYDALIKKYEGEKKYSFHYINANLLGTGKQKYTDMEIEGSRILHLYKVVGKLARTHM